MELNKLLKTLLVVAPIMALSACSSTDSATDASGSSSSIGGNGSGAGVGGVETGSVAV